MVEVLLKYGLEETAVIDEGDHRDEDMDHKDEQSESEGE